MIAVQDPDGTASGTDTSIMDGMSRKRARVCADTSSSLSSPSKLEIYDQAELDDLLSGRGQDARDARQNVRSLDIRRVERVPEEWPRLPSLQHLSITVDKMSLAEFPRVLRASALPALRSLNLKCEDDYGDRAWAYPVLEGRFEQLNDIQIDGFGMERNALDAVLRQLPNLTTLKLIANNIGTEGCGHLAEALREHACPNLTHLDLGSNGIVAEGCGHLAEALREHACPSLTHLHLQWI